jgi:hypothetical protein
VLQVVTEMFRLIVYNYGQCRADVLLRDGALQAVVFAVLHVCGLKTSQAGGTDRLISALCAFWQCLDVVLNMTDEVRTQLTEDVYNLSRNDIYRVNVAVYRLLDGCIDDTCVCCQLHTAAAAYGYYLWDFHDADVLQSYLLHKPPRMIDAKPLALLMAESAIAYGEANGEFKIMKLLWEAIEDIPTVADILDALASPPARVAKDRHCAFPGCEVVGTGLRNNLKKCGRCMEVYYCCKEHQEDHWPEHKATCVKNAATADEPDGVES